MAQPMTGTDSAPIARSNAPLSIYKEENPMTSRTPKTAKNAATEPVNVEQPVVEQSVAEQPATVATDDLAYLVAQRKALDEQIKAAKASQPTVSKLERVIAKQDADQGTKWVPVVLTNRAAARIAAGQPQDEAIAAVLAQYRALMVAKLARGAEQAEQA